MDLRVITSGTGLFRGRKKSRTKRSGTERPTGPLEQGSDTYCLVNLFARGIHTIKSLFSVAERLIQVFFDGHRGVVAKRVQALTCNLRRVE